MAFFDDVKNKVTQVGHSAAKSARDFSETTKLNSQISDTEKQINQLYTQIGYEIYCAHNADPLPEVAQLIEQLNALHDQIEGLRAQVQTINASSLCPGCGAKIRPGMAFCSSCGTKLPQPEPAQPAAPQNRCPVCGAPTAADALFCTSCGTRLTLPEELNGLDECSAPTGLVMDQLPEICPTCGTVLPKGTIYCTNCGSSVLPTAGVQPQPEVQPASQPVPQNTVCPRCGTTLAAGTLFCTNCGEPQH